MFVMAAKGISILYKNKESRIFLRICFVIYFVILIYSALNIDFKISTRNELYNPNETSFYITNVYSYNLEKVINGIKIYNKEKLDIIRYVNENMKSEITNDNIEINTGILEKIWFYSWFSVKENKSFYLEENREIKDYLNSDKKYLIYFYKSEDEEIENIKKAKILYKNNSGIILEK